MILTFQMNAIGNILIGMRMSYHLLSWKQKWPIQAKIFSKKVEEVSHIIPALEKLRQEDCKFEGSLGYNIVNLRLIWII